MSATHVHCQCGTTQVKLTVVPKVRFRCHCTKCQQIYDAPFSDAVFVRRGQAQLVDTRTIQWVKTLKYSPLWRGMCQDCSKPVLAHFYGALSILPAYMLDPSILPPVTTDVYYATRVTDIDDDVPKRDGVIASHLGLCLPLAAILALPGKSIHNPDAR